MPEYRTPIEKPSPWKEFRTRCKTKAALPFFFIEWSCACGAYWLSRWSFLQMLEYAGGLSILIAAIFWLIEAPDRTQQRHFQAWMVINTAQGKRGSGGRIEALQELAADKIKLVGVDISNGDMQGLSLDNAELQRANFETSDLRNASLQHAHLDHADFQHANLQGADLRNADLTSADFTDADLTNANLTGAILTGADFTAAVIPTLDKENLNKRGALFRK